MSKITTFAICLLMATLGMSAVSHGQTASELLQRGLYLEETVGDLNAAIGIYKQVVQMAAVSRFNVAQAEYRMGLCQQKQGHQAEAIHTFQKLVREYPEQVEIVAKARKLLPVESQSQESNPKPCQSLEEEIAGNPEDVSLRETTISCYYDAQIRAGYSSEKGRELEKKRLEHIVWLIQRAPQTESAGSSPSTSVTSSESYIKVRQAWLGQIPAHSDDANVLANAGHFLLGWDKDKAEEFTARAHALDPKNVRAALYLADACELKMHTGKPEVRLQMAQRALQLREEIHGVKLPAEYSDLGELQHLAVDAFEAADDAKAQKYAEDLSRHDDGDAIHQGNIVLGRLALKRGDVEEAKNRLLAAGKIPGRPSPALGSFGPNMMLAQELLLKGEKEVVLQYFDECAGFWKYGASKLDEWRLAVSQGRIPNFGANLIY